MTRKKQARKLGKEIRKATGIKLPVAMRIARLVVRGRFWDLIWLPATQEAVREIAFWCGWGCCGGSGKYEVVGPKGSFRLYPD